MSYVLSSIGEAALAPPPDPTSQALTLLGMAAVPCLPIAAGIAGGMYVGKGQSAVAPVVGGLLGVFVSVLMLRSSVLSGQSSVARTA